MLAPLVAKPKAPPGDSRLRAKAARLPGAIQYKLAVGAANDPLEHEADRISEQIMRMPAAAITASAAPPRISRKCAACAGEEETIRRAEAPGPLQPAAGAAPEIVHEVLRGPGRPLDAGTRAFFEPRFGHDFGRVRVHDGEREAASATALRARAFAVGERIVFGRGEYAPSSQAGRQLLAHELAHVVQQGAVGAAPRVQRRLVVDPSAGVPLPTGFEGPPTPLTFAVQGLMRNICPDGGATVDGTSGVASLATADFCTTPKGAKAGTPTGAAKSKNPVGCQCLCNVIGHAQTTSVAFRAGGPGTVPGPGPAGTIPGTGGVATSPTIGADPRFQGQYFVGGKWVDIPFHLIFAHELCGHALSLMQGTQVPPAAGPAGGTPPHEVVAVDVERAIAAEQGLPRRPDDYGGAARQRP